ncbi:amine oxidase [Laetiporus sulphureus 93-53]|uniref:Amine oxidase n=1 Tax=Laetiporus sulphureus 93-53 TaxID=1314785 RepID=A0A165DNF2_9APHY|nr:amine oxidase [Laetiporus sulphureus 93-53]KZT05264.1 amine oxidase [Laetiporus sulphureus 93-53]
MSIPAAARSIGRAQHESNLREVDPTVLILGGGVAGVIAARTLYEQGITDFIIVEARDELGGRLQTETIGMPGNEWVVERGANWVQGTQTADGPVNPIWELVQKHQVKTVYSDWSGSITTYDESGAVNYTDIFNDSDDYFTTLTVVAGERVQKQLVDLTARSGYSLIDAKPMTPAEKACEYYQFDWEYAQTPVESSLIASSWANNFTYDPDMGGFGDDNMMSIDQRGFKHFIQTEAAEFLQPPQVMYNATVADIAYSTDGVSVTLTNGTELVADYALCTFSLGVLQNDDVTFEPQLPDWKQEAIQSMVMATYTKIFLQFEEDFWFDTQLGLYADTTRGRYPVWQNMNLTAFFPGSGVIFVTVTGEYSVRIEALSDDEVKAEVLQVLQTMYPNATIPEPTAFYFPRWHTNPLFRGSYSNWPPSFTSGHHTNLRATVDERLWFAGEATSIKYFGFLHGAYYEGLNVATSMAQCIQAGGCTGLEFIPEIRNAYPYEV